MGKKGFVIKADGANPLPWNLIVGQKVRYEKLVLTSILNHFFNSIIIVVNFDSDECLTIKCL